MMDGMIEYLRQANPTWVYCALFLGSYIENLLPPAPGDTVLVFGAYLAGRNVINVWMTFGISTFGSIAGFMTMFGVGRFLDRKIIETGKWRFFSGDAFRKTERWFQKYGLWIIAINRFLSGARAVVSLFAGIVRLNAGKVFGLAILSCSLWNAVIIYAGVKIGENWEVVVRFITHYNTIIFTMVILFGLIYFTVRFFVKKLTI